MALTVNTTLIPGQTIVTDDITGGIAIVPPNYSNVYQQIVSALAKLAPAVFEDTVSITDDIVSLTAALSRDPTGCFVEAEGIPVDTFIVDYYSTETAPEEFEYFCKLSSPVDATIESVSVRLISPDIMLVKQLNLLNVSQSGILETHQGIKTLGEGNGFHIVGPWEWLGMSSIVKLYKERGVDLVALKAEVDAVPKSI